MRLKLLRNGPLLVTEDFLESFSPAVSVMDVQFDYFGHGDEPDYEAIQALLSKANGNAVEDAHFAAKIHELLPLTRREASRSEFWHYLTVVEVPEYAALRWRTKDQKNRVLGRWSRNALGRLWWYAELTRDPSDEDPYRWTKAVRSQRHMLFVVDELPADNRTFILELSRRLSGLTGSIDDFSDRFWRIFRARIGAIALDALPEGAVRRLVNDCLIEAESVE